MRQNGRRIIPKISAGNVAGRGLERVKNTHKKEAGWDGWGHNEREWRESTTGPVSADIPHQVISPQVERSVLWLVHKLRDFIKNVQLTCCLSLRNACRAEVGEECSLTRTYKRTRVFPFRCTLMYTFQSPSGNLINFEDVWMKVGKTQWQTFRIQWLMT